MQTMIDYLQEYNSISELLARQLKEAGLLDIIGRGATKQYRLKK